MQSKTKHIYHTK